MTLWGHLSFPHTTPHRSKIYNILLLIQKLTTYLDPYCLPPIAFILPDKTSRPSIIEQVVHKPVAILSPYTLALQRNYYFALSPEPIEMSEPVTTNNMDCNASRNSSPSRSVASSAVVTVEHSLAAIAEVIKDMEMDDPPTQPEIGFETPKIVHVKSSSYSHRFAMYRKRWELMHPAAQHINLPCSNRLLKPYRPSTHQPKSYP